ncbi:hypothetical protein PGT21_018614 [Puccinia graminis f. sp. tritici]|uniref:Uncharacterized protein n=1 Tax=Puccinia graminis f. sp. tritici TaxID=56615 RepID=A0A5B0QG71_PUCGR|nr:hypothetical protein PGT21_018614 [Puccinia graminis f. sp. tritici]
MTPPHPPISPEERYKFHSALHHSPNQSVPNLASDHPLSLDHIIQAIITYHLFSTSLTPSLQFAVMSIDMNNILHGDLEDPNTRFEGVKDEPSPIPNEGRSSSNKFEHTDPTSLFDPLPTSIRNVEMTDGSVSHHDDDTIEEVCDKLQSQLKLDPQHLKIALITSKVNPSTWSCSSPISHFQCSICFHQKFVPEPGTAAVIFANAAYHQLDGPNTGIATQQTANFVFDQSFRVTIKQNRQDFVRKTAQIILLLPTLEAYSNNPHKNGALPKTLFYRTLPDAWKEEHLQPSSNQDIPQSPSAYREAVGDLLKYQRSNLRVLLLRNILETKRIFITDHVPNHDNCRDYTPSHENYVMRARMCYARLVMVYFYVHKSKKDSQWSDIDERLAVLQGLSCEFQQHHLILVLNKDFLLFSQKRNYKSMKPEEFSVPTLEEVQDSAAHPDAVKHTGNAARNLMLCGSGGIAEESPVSHI